MLPFPLWHKHQHIHFSHHQDKIHVKFHINLPFTDMNGYFLYHVNVPPLGGAGGIQSQYQSRKQLPEEDAAGERAVAPVRLPLLLLHVGL